MSDSLGLEAGVVDLITLHDGRTLSTHGPQVCFGPYCCIHRPSPHPLNTAPLTWISTMQMMFRVCVHENLHPDPDALQFHQLLALARQAVPYDGDHQCCDIPCCVEASVNE